MQISAFIFNYASLFSFWHFWVLHKCFDFNLLKMSETFCKKNAKKI